MNHQRRHEDQFATDNDTVALIEEIGQRIESVPTLAEEIQQVWEELCAPSSAT